MPPTSTTRDEDQQTRQPREPLDTDIEFIADFDLLQAKGINISEGGLAFEVPAGLPFEMRFFMEGRESHFRAELVWMKRLPDGSYRMGLKFLDHGGQADL